jgi:GIY-YIG catalytic domain
MNKVGYPAVSCVLLKGDAHTMVEDASTPVILERVMALLAECGEPLTSGEIARRVLHLASAPAGLAETIMADALRGDPRLTRDGDGRWRLTEAPPGPVVDSAVWVHMTGPRPRVDRPIVLAARTRSGRAFLTCCDPRGPVHADRLRLLGLRREDLIDAPSASRARAALGRVVRGTGVVVWDRTQVRALAPDVSPALVLAPVLVRAGVTRRRDPIVEAAARLGVSWDGRTTADVLAHLVLEIHDAADAEGLTDLPETVREEVEVPAWARDLPDGPGVYRFLAANGEILYVGKARSLQARVRTYFGGSDRRKHHGALMAHVAGVRVEETATEVEALLLEAETIREVVPPYNVQMATARRSGHLGDAILFLPAAAGRVGCILVTGGRVALRTEVGPKNKGIGRLDEALREHVFGAREVPPDDGAGEILKTWLRRSGDRVSCLDLAAVTSATAASRLLRSYLRDPDLLEGNVRHYC